MDQTLLTIFIIVTAVAVVIQMAILMALYLAVKKTGARVEALADQVQQRALPTLDVAQSMLTESRAKVDTIVDNLASVSTTVRGQVERLDVTLTEVVDRTRLQVLRADELVTRTMDRVEHTSELVQHGVVSPVRHIAGVVQGVTAGIGTLFGRRGPRDGRGIPKDEMFV
jgi:hypothetical protein